MSVDDLWLAVYTDHGKGGQNGKLYRRRQLGMAGESGDKRTCNCQNGRFMDHVRDYILGYIFSVVKNYRASSIRQSL